MKIKVGFIDDGQATRKYRIYGRLHELDGKATDKLVVAPFFTNYSIYGKPFFSEASKRFIRESDFKDLEDDYLAEHLKQYFNYEPEIQPVWRQ